MAKQSKRKFLFITAFLLILLISSAYASLVPSVHAAETTTQEKGLAILNDVVGLDLTKYATKPKEYPQDSYFGVVPEENVGYTLESNESKLKMFCTFANGKLHILHVLETEGSPLMTKSAVSVLEMAKDFLSNYQSYSGNSFYGELGSMLDKVDASKNLTTTSGNVKLEVTTSEDYTTFSWTYTFNGVGAGDKCVVLGYKNGLLKYFVDAWDLYKIGSTAVNLSEEEAVAIAVEHAKTYSWKVVSGNDTFEVKDFKVTKPMVTQLIFGPSLYADKARSDDLLTLYPMWRIGVGLDKFYPGNVYGIYVDIWADTKEIRHIEETFSTLGPEFVGSQLFDEGNVAALNSQASGGEVKSNSVSIVGVAFPAGAIVVLGTAPIWLSRKKNSSRLNLPKLRSSRITIGLLCLLLSSTVLLFPISTANADNRRATIWGDRDYLKTDPEKQRQQETASAITWLFNFHSYVASNYQGSNTVKANILYQIGDSEQNYQKAAVVYFDHGDAFNLTFPPEYEPECHYSVYDNNGVQVFDHEIYLETAGKTFFAFISTCFSARITKSYIWWNGKWWPIGFPTPQGMSPSGHAVGMPFAFTHRIVGYDMSSDGYANPDGGAFCYIGFPYGSASLSQLVDPQNHPWSYYYLWVQRFFYEALEYGWTVNGALDQASLTYFSSLFGGTRLHNGFYPVWGEQWPFDDSTMVVYGNGNLYLYHPPTAIGISAWAFTGYTYQQIDAPVYIDGQYAGSTGWTYTRIPVAPGYHTVGVDPSVYGLIFQGFYVDGYYQGSDNPITVSVASETETWVNAVYGTAPPCTPSINGPSPPTYVGAEYVFSACSTDPDGENIRYEFNWDDGTSTTTDWYTSGATAYASHAWSSTGLKAVTVRAQDTGGLWSSWSSPYTINVENPPQYYWLTVYAINNFGNSVPTEVYIDGQWVGMAGDSFYVPAGNHYIGAEGIVWDEYGTWGLLGFTCGGLGENPVCVFVNSDMEVTAVYQCI